MNREYYISSWRMNHRISESHIDGSHIVVDGIVYEQVSRAPIGRRVVRRLINEDTNTRISIYN